MNIKPSRETSESRILISFPVMSSVCSNLTFEEASALRTAFLPYFKEYQINCSIPVTDPDGVISVLPGVTDVTVQLYNEIIKFGSNLCYLMAAKQGILYVFRLLLKLGVDPDIIVQGKFDNKSALDLAVNFNHIEIIKELVKYGINPMKPGRFTIDSSLHTAARLGYIDLLKYLFSIGIDINTPGNDGNNVLIPAIFGGQAETFRFLLDHGANIAGGEQENIFWTNPQSVGNIVLFYSLFFSANSEITKMILDAGVKPHVVTPGRGYNGLQILIGRNGTSPEIEDGTFLQVKYLLDTGLDINFINHEGHTALSMAAEYKRGTMLKLLFNVELILI